MKKPQLFPTFDTLNQTIIKCRQCPRLVEFRENVPPRKSFENETFWRKPLPGFGDVNGWLMIVGLAPAPQGGNRTGRMFTGDNTGRFLMRMLYLEGFANLPICESLEDGLELYNCFATAVVKCAPPKHKPLPQEILNCNCYYENELSLLKNVTSILALGKVAFDTTLKLAKKSGQTTKGMHFSHGAKIAFDDFPSIYGSYHPSQRNTNTGTLTEKMFRSLLQTIKHNHLVN